MITSDVDLLSPEAVADPHAASRAIREAGPAVWLPAERAWFLSTYEEVSGGFHDLRLSSDRLTPLEARLDPQRRALLAQTLELLGGWMVFHDPPDHTRLREPLKRAFTPRRVEALRPRIVALVEELLDGIDRAGEVDLVAEYAFPLPAIVIAELLGVPASDRERFKTWSDKLSGIVFGASRDPGQAADAAAGSAEFAGYFAWLIERYTAEPADNLISALIATARAEPEGRGLSPVELVGACTLLLFGGHETTTNLIGNALHALLRHPDELAALRERPASAAAATEELHRFDGSTKVMVRVVAEDHERAGQPLERGQTVLLGVASANRDEAVFADADRLVLDRPDAHRHLGFGFGAHFCLGAHLARLEAQHAIPAVVARFPDLRPTTEEVAWRATLLSRGLEALPVAVR